MMTSTITCQALARARATFEAGDYTAARMLCSEILKEDPQRQDARHLLALVAHAQGNPYESLALLNALIEDSPTDIDARLSRARLHVALKKFEKAIADYEEVIKALPGNLDALNGLALLLQTLQRHGESLKWIAAAIEAHPETPALHFNRGNLLAIMGRFQEAAGAFERALQLKPDWPDAHFNLGNALRHSARFVQAAQSYHQAIELKPEYGDAYLNLGVCLVAMGNVDEAITAYEKARQCGVDAAQVTYNLANALKAAGRFEGAIEHYDKVPASSAHYSQAQWNKGLTLLLLGNYEQGWPLYEWRWQRRGVKDPRSRLRSKKCSDLESLKGKRVFVRCEQGQGDVFQFARYANLLAQAGAHVILQCHVSQLSVLRTLDGVVSLCSLDDPVPEHDCHCDMASLPLLFKTKLTSVPAAIPYLHPDPAKVQVWSDRLGVKAKPRIGVVWSSVSGFKDDHRRSIEFVQFAQALEAEKFDYICLQKEIKEGDHQALAARPDVRVFCDEIQDYGDTAALIQNCDLVISTCTSVPHLSGAMGKPTWILLNHVPDFRWLIGRTDSPWYPGARLLRQSRPGVWQDVLETVRKDLRSL